MSAAEQLFVLAQHDIERQLSRFRLNRYQQSVLIRKIIGVKAVIGSRGAGDAKCPSWICLDNRFHVVDLRIVLLERNCKVRMSFAELPHVPLSEQQRDW